MTQTIDYLAEKDAFLSVYVNYAADKRIVFNTETHAFEWKKNTINDDEVQYMSEWNQCWYAWKHCAESKANAVTECTWTHDSNEEMYGNWHTSCGGIFTLSEGTPTENRLNHCCYCGGKLIEAQEPSHE